MSWIRIALVVSLMALSSSALADSPPTPEQRAQILDRLEQSIAAQQSRIESLRSQLASTEQAQQDVARADVMRQQIREILSEQEFREALMPATLQAGYDDGFFIRSSDQLFMLKVNGRMQFRWTHYATSRENRYLNLRQQRDDRTGFDVERLRLRFSGYVYDKNLTYLTEFRSDNTDSYNTRIQFAYLNYRFADELQFRAGIFRLASTRQQFNSSATLQFVDRPMVDAVFGLGIGTGVRLWGTAFAKRLEYYLDVANSLNGTANATITPDPADLDSNPAILFRAVWNALGDKPGDDFRGESDTPLHKNPALQFGFHYAFNDDQGDRRTTRIPFPIPRSLRDQGGFGLTNTNGLQINQFGLDSSFKWNGLSITGEYIVRLVDPRRAGRSPFTPWWLLSGDDSTTAQHGAYVQAGYFLPIPGLENKVEAVARVGGISTLAEEREGAWEYTGGLNYYLQGHKVKLQTEVSKVTESPTSDTHSSLANVNDEALIFRVQLQVWF